MITCSKFLSTQDKKRFSQCHTTSRNIPENTHLLTPGKYSFREFTFISVQSLSHVQLFVTPFSAAYQASLSFTTTLSFLKHMSIELVMPSNHLILCRPLLLLPSIFPSIRIFSSESALYIRWPNYWNFNFKISPSNEHPGLVSSTMDWFDLIILQGILTSLFQHHSTKASIL